MSPPPLSHFPDLCLLAIFKHIPLSDLIRHIGLVCPNWARVQRDELKRRRSTKHLVIVQDYDQTELSIALQYDNPYESDLISHVRRDDDGLPWAPVELNPNNFNAIRVPSDVPESNDRTMAESFTSPLIALLPNITHLTIFQNGISQIDSVVVSLEQIVLLLNQYSTKLVSLKLNFFSFNSLDPMDTDLNNYESSVRALFDSINRLTSLRHLSLNVNFRKFQAHSRLSILSRLSTFTVHFFEPSSLLIESIRHYAATGEVRIDCSTALETKLREMAQLDPQVATKFTRACIINVSDADYDKTRLFCTRFNSLTTLGLYIRSMPMTMLARCLSLLPQLISLKLNFSSIDSVDTPEPQIAQVPSVRLLTLIIRTKSHHDTERLHLHQIFPNLQVLHLMQYSNRCRHCQYEYCFTYQLSKDPQLVARIAHCMSLARQSFRQCVSLHTIRLKTDHQLQQFVLLPQELITVDQL